MMLPIWSLYFSRNSPAEVDIFIDLFLRHADTPIDNLKGLFLLVQLHVDINRTQLSLEVARSGQGLHFLRCIHRIGHQFTQENLVVGIQELLDHRENAYLCCFIILQHLSNKNRPARGRSDKLSLFV